MKKNILISNVVNGSVSEKAGIISGDELLSVNNICPTDILQYFSVINEKRLSLKISRNNEILTFKIVNPQGCDIGIDFEEEVFDGIRPCKNKCIFCFSDQNNPQCRNALNFKDDDYRLSFLHGNFITLNNLSEYDWKRIEKERLGPLYVSVHALSPKVRKRLFENPLAENIKEKLERLCKIEIPFHTQIVLCPSINDGEILNETIEGLSSYYPYMQSIGVVPVGITKYTKNKDLFAIDKEKAIEVIDVVCRFGDIFRKKNDTSLVWASDEFYLKAGIEFPSYNYYEGFPQLENGIGLSRKFITDFKRRYRFLREKSFKEVLISVITGNLGEKVFDYIKIDLLCLGELLIKIVPVKNETFGDTVTVSGLLGGKDILRYKEVLKRSDICLLPSNLLKFDNGTSLFIDDITLHDLKSELGIPVMPIFPDGKEFYEFLKRFSY